jgi:hypothetical protein
MADAYYYVGDSGQQQGPVAADEIIGLIRRGTVRAETLTWTAGMSDWARADAVPVFASAFASAPPPLRPRAAAVASTAAGPLTGAFPAWGLFWRSIVLALGIIFVLPAPWAGVWFYKWLASKVVLPGGRPLRLQGQVGEVWWLFAGFGLVQWIGPTLNVALDVRWGGALSSILGVVLGWALVRWFCGHVETEDGATKIAFAGGVLPYIGWSLLVAVSFVTVIGWAWAFKYFLRWICARIEGAPRFAFNGGGFAILWRVVVLAIFSMLVIPIPWLLKWYGNWMISQFSAEPEAQR